MNAQIVKLKTPSNNNWNSFLQKIFVRSPDAKTVYGETFDGEQFIITQYLSGDIVAARVIEEIFAGTGWPEQIQQGKMTAMDFVSADLLGTINNKHSPEVT